MLHFTAVFLCFPLVASWLNGIPPEDAYESTCYEAASTLYLFGSPCPTANYTADPNSSSCPCSDYRFTETVVNCINRLAKNFSSPQDYSSALNTSLTTYAATCAINDTNSLTAFLSNSSQLPPYQGNVSDSPGTWAVTNSFALSDKEVYDAYITVTKMNARETYSEHYGTALIGYWAGIFAIQMSIHFFTKLFFRFTIKLQNTWLARQWRQKVTLGKLKHGTLTPTEFMILSPFMAMSIVFMFPQLGVWYPNFYSLYNNTYTYAEGVGMRTGVLILYILPLLILFAGRNNFLQLLTGWSQNTFFMFHRWVARIEVLLVIAHTIAYTIAYVSGGYYTGAWSYAFWCWGVVALVFGCFTVVQGLRFIRRRAYDLFVFLHIIAAIMFLVGGYWHLKLLGVSLGLYFMYACFAVWGFDRLVRLLRVIYSGFCHYPQRPHWYSFGMPAQVEMHYQTLVVTVDRPPAWNLVSGAGKHVYVHILTGWHWWQSHPFTIVESGANRNQLKLFVRVYKGITKHLAQTVIQHGNQINEEEKSSNPSSHHLQIRVLLDGPYGHDHQLSKYQELICVAGGSGITAPFSYIQKSLKKLPSGTQRIRLYWAVTTEQEKWFDQELQHISQHQNVEVYLFYTRDPNAPTKFSVNDTLTAAIKSVSGPTAVVCCGPQRLNDAVKAVVKQQVTLTPYVLQYYEESFSF